MPHAPQRSRCRRFWRTAALVCLTLAVLAAPACRRLRNGAPDETGAAPPAPKAWWQQILPPKGEFFFDERSHDIEHNLDRNPNVTLDRGF